MAASSHSSFPTCSPCSVWTSHMPPFRLCSESWELWVAMVEGANKKELMCLARSLGGLVPEECLHLLPPAPILPSLPLIHLPSFRAIAEI